ncbi:MAG: alkaline phosphatase family protein [Candidatus Omnitrophica bacterium]|nr:alkaline phosphatase family protein [Candidatus Omnitrophota bacterium]
MNNKVVVIGVDGVSYGLIKKLTSRGKMPNVAKLLKEGCAGALESTIFPVSPSAWSSSFTGKNPAKTGIYGFYKRVKASYDWAPVTARERASKDLWEIVSELGKRSIVLGFPLTLPTRDFNGILVGGNFTPNLEEAVYPNDLKEKILKELNYDICAHEASGAEIIQSIQKRFNVARFLLNNYEWDLFMLGFEQTEIIHHFIMFENPKSMERIYEKFDQMLAQFLEALPKSTKLLMYSDHGNTTYFKNFHLPSWLKANGYLKFKDAQKIASLNKEKLGYELASIRKRQKNAFAAGTMSFVYLLAKFAKRHFRFIKKIFPFLSTPVNARPQAFGFERGIFKDIFYDFERSLAYPAKSTAGNYGGIYINLQGRDVQGKVNMGEEYETLRKEIAQGLLEFSDPQTGKKVIRKVWKKEELYRGPFLDEIYDLVFEADKDYYVSSADEDITQDSIIRGYYHSQHELDGIILAHGENIRKGREVKGGIINIMPTILHLLGLPVPSDIDGKVEEEIFVEEYLQANPVKTYQADNAVRVGQKDVIQPQELEQIKRQLEQMGYIG